MRIRHPEADGNQFHIEMVGVQAFSRIPGRESSRESVIEAIERRVNSSASCSCLKLICRATSFIAPEGRSFSQHGKKGNLAMRLTNGSVSSNEINTTSCWRERSARARAVIGLRCPKTGSEMKPIFIV